MITPLYTPYSVLKVVRLNRLLPVLLNMMIFTFPFFSFTECEYIKADNIGSPTLIKTYEHLDRFPLTFSSNDAILSIANEKSIDLVNTSSFQTFATLHHIPDETRSPNNEDTEMISGITFSPDSKKLYSSSSWYDPHISNKGSLKVWDTATGKQIDTLESGVSIKDMTINFDGLLLGYRKGFRTINILNLQTGDTVSTFTRLGRDGGMPLFSPTNNIFAYLSEGIVLWDVDLKTEHTVINTSNRDIAGFVFSPDGSMLAVWDDSTNLLDLYSVETGKQISVIANKGNGIRDVKFDTKGVLLGYVMSGDTSIHIFNTTLGKEIEALPFGNQSIVNIDFTHNGSLLASSNWNGRAIIQNVVSREQLFDHDFGEQILLSFSPKDNFITVRGLSQSQIWGC